MSIGTFNNRSSCISKFYIFNHLSFMMILLITLLNLKRNIMYYFYTLGSILRDSILNIDFTLVIILLVLMSGDVAENPGPITNMHESQNCISLMHMNIRSIQMKLITSKISLWIWYFMFHWNSFKQWYWRRFTFAGRLF